MADGPAHNPVDPADDVVALAERAVLGAALLDPDVAAVLRTLVSPEDFRDPAHATICQAMVAVVASGAPLDVVTLASELRRRDRIHAIGGAQAIGELTDGIATTAHVEAHARMVREAAAVRRTVAEAERVVALGRGGASLDDVGAAARRAAAAAADAEASDAAPVSSLADAVDDALELLTSLTERGTGCGGLSTGIQALDRVIGGLRPGLLYVLAGRPAMGKTALLQDVLEAVAGAEQQAAARDQRPELPTLFFSLEMPRAELGQRALAKASRIDLARLINGLLAQDELTRVFNAARVAHPLPMRIVAGPAKYSRIRAIAHREKARAGGVRAIGVDYLQLVRPDQRNENREREIAEISAGMKALAGELGCPVIELSQLNRSLEARKDKRPMLFDLRESGAIEQDADVVMFVYRDEVYNPNTEDRGIAEIIVAKQRNGPAGVARVRFDKACTGFSDLAADGTRGGSAPAIGEAPGDHGDGLPIGNRTGPLFDSDGPSWDFP